MSRLSFIFLAMFAVVATGCHGLGTTPASSPIEIAATPPTDTPVAASTGPASGLTLGTDPIEYQGYTLSKQMKTEKMDGRPAEFSYAVLKRGGKTIAIFDGLQHPYGNATEFGLVSLLGGAQKQFLIEQSIHRGSGQWIVSVEPSIKVIFDSEKIGLGSGITPVDIDHDNIFELSSLIVFYGFAHLAMSDSPKVEVLLKYDAAVQWYLPANHRSTDYTLRGIDEDIRSLPAATDAHYRTRLLNVVLRYLYAGKKRIGWNFFETNYKLSDKVAVKTELQTKLRRDRVYQLISAASSGAEASVR